MVAKGPLISPSNMTDRSLPTEIKYYGNYVSSNLKYSVLKAHFDLSLYRH